MRDETTTATAPEKRPLRYRKPRFSIGAMHGSPKLAAWIDTFKDWHALGESLGVTRQAVTSWRRYAYGAARGNNAYPPGVDNAQRIVELSAGALTLDDIFAKPLTPVTP